MIIRWKTCPLTAIPKKLSDFLLLFRCHLGNTPLHYAAIGGCISTCRLLLQTNPSLLNQSNFHGVGLLQGLKIYLFESVKQLFLYPVAFVQWNEYLCLCNIFQLVTGTEFMWKDDRWWPKSRQKAVHLRICPYDVPLTSPSVHTWLCWFSLKRRMLTC